MSDFLEAIFNISSCPGLKEIIEVCSILFNLLFSFL